MVRKQISGCWRQGEGKEPDSKGTQRTFGSEEVPYTLVVVVVTQLYAFAKARGTVWVPRVNFNVCKFNSLKLSLKKSLF